MSLSARISSRLRAWRPDRVVRRDVQGVSLVLPWSHRLPDYAEQFPGYGQNLVALARVVGGAEPTPFVMVDVGANVGDSALQVLAEVDARVICVEGDDYWLRFLHRNVDAEPRVRVVPALVLPESAFDAAVAPVRARGTTRFVEDDSVIGGNRVTPDDLRDQNADLGRVRLIKSDTDGYDTRIVPAMARAWAAEHPVLFFEYDHDLTRKAGQDDPTDVWSELAQLGYDVVAVWDNFGEPLGSMPISEVAVAAAALDLPFGERGYHYWDVAVVHCDDASLVPAVTELVSGPRRGPSARGA